MIVYPNKDMRLPHFTLEMVSKQPSQTAALLNRMIDEISKLVDVTSQPGEKVQSDWAETDINSEAYILNKPRLSTVALTGDYDDLSNTPVVDAALSNSSTNAVENRAITAGINAKQDTLVSGTNIKTVNGNNLLGSGDIPISATPSPGSITASMLASSVSNMFNYSTSERSTGFTWTNGKTIYKKTIVYSNGFPSGTQDINIPHGISGLSQVVQLEIVGKDSASTFIIPGISGDGSNHWGVWNVTSTNIHIIKNSSLDVVGTWWFTIYYTK